MRTVPDPAASVASESGQCVRKICLNLPEPCLFGWDLIGPHIGLVTLIGKERFSLVNVTWDIIKTS